MLVFIHSASIFQLHDGPFGLIGGLVSYSHAVGDDWFFALDEVFFLLGIRNLIRHSSRAAYDGRHSPENLLGPFSFPFGLSSTALSGLNIAWYLEIWRFGHGKNSPPPRHSRVSLAATLLRVFIPYYYYYSATTALTTSSCSYGFLPLGTVDNFCWRRTGLEAQMT